MMNFAVQADHRVKIKENEQTDKYLDLARELKVLWNMEVTVIPIVIGAFGKIPTSLIKGLDELEIGRPTETIYPSALLRSVRIFKRILDIWRDLLSLRLQWMTIS